jgi:hypothetical protein
VGAARFAGERGFGFSVGLTTTTGGNAVEFWAMAAIGYAAHNNPAATPDASTAAAPCRAASLWRLSEPSNRQFISAVVARSVFAQASFFEGRVRGRWMESFKSCPFCGNQTVADIENPTPN